MKKVLVLLKWIILSVPVGLFAIITAPIMYPVYYFTEWKWLWIYGDSNKVLPDGSFEEDYRIYLIQNNGSEIETPKSSYKWHALRNTMWNLRVWITNLQKGDGSGMTNQSFVIDKMTLDGNQVSDGGKWAMVCGLKYKVEEGQDPWQGWTGDVIDFGYSILGQSLMFFNQDGIYSFRYSFCKKMFFNRWLSIKVTCIKTDVTLHFKIT